MKKTVIALVASAGIALAPMSPLLAETGVAKDADAFAMAWVPATQAEQQAARGGTSNTQYNTITSVLRVFCPRLTIRLRFCPNQDT